jgi:hypothetical protein
LRNSEFLTWTVYLSRISPKSWKLISRETLMKRQGWKGKVVVLVALVVVVAIMVVAVNALVDLNTIKSEISNPVL